MSDPRALPSQEGSALDADAVARGLAELEFDARVALPEAQERFQRAEAEVERLKEALMSIWIYLRIDGDHEDHVKFGAACGVDACILCLAAETARGALRGSR